MEAYLDHAATTPVRPEVVEAMAPFWSTRFANPTGRHRAARDARQALDEARHEIAELLGCDAGEVVLTSGGTEADNLAIGGSLAARPGRGVCPATEHVAVLRPVVGSGGVVVPVDACGLVDLDALAAALQAEPAAVVSVMAANNETGVVADLEAVAAVVRSRPDPPALHTDAVQAAPWLDLRALPVDLLTVSAHKLGGPRGVGALVVRGGTPLRAQLLGGSQERDRRAGTQDVGGAVGLAVALRLSAAERAGVGVARRRDALEAALVAAGAIAVGAGASRLPGHLQVCFDAPVESDELLVLLDDAGVAASAGSSCASGASEPSHVLAAMGLPIGRVRAALRLTLGRQTTEAEVAHAAEATVAAVTRLRGA